MNTMNPYDYLYHGPESGELLKQAWYPYPGGYTNSQYYPQNSLHYTNSGPVSSAYPLRYQYRQSMGGSGGGYNNPYPHTDSYPAYRYNPSSNGRYPKKKNKAWIWITLAVVVLLTGIVGTIWMLMRPQPKLQIHVMTACEPSFSGNNGEGSMQMTCQGSYEAAKASDEQLARAFLSSVTYEIENQENGKLSNGDKIQVKAVFNEQTASEYGLEPVETTAEFDVAGLDNIFGKWSDFSEEQKSILNDLVAKKINYEFSDTYLNVDKVDLIEIYLNLRPEDGTTYTDVTYLCKVQTTNIWYSNPEPQTNYYAVSVLDLNPKREMKKSLDGAQTSIEQLYLSEQSDIAARESLEARYNGTLIPVSKS